AQLLAYSAALQTDPRTHCILQPAFHTTHAPPSPHSLPTRRSSDLEHELPVGRLGRRDGRPGLLRFDRERDHHPGQDHPGGEWKRSEEHTSELQSRFDLVCRLLLEKKNTHVKCIACVNSSMVVS